MGSMTSSATATCSATCDTTEKLQSSIQLELRSNEATKPGLAFAGQRGRPALNRSSNPPGVAFVQAPCGGWFVLKDTEQDTSMGYRTTPRTWEVMLDLDEQGVAFAEAE